MTNVLVHHGETPLADVLGEILRRLAFGRELDEIESLAIEAATLETALRAGFADDPAKMAEMTRRTAERQERDRAMHRRRWVDVPGAEI